MTEDDIANLRDRAVALVKLLDEGEHGLFTWQAAVNDAWWDVVVWAPPLIIRERLEQPANDHY